MTILETSIALMVLGIAIMGILSGIYMASKVSASSRNRILALQDAQAEMEEIKNQAYTQIPGTIVPEGKLITVEGESGGEVVELEGFVREE